MQNWKRNNFYFTRFLYLILSFLGLWTIAICIINLLEIHTDIFFEWNILADILILIKFCKSQKILRTERGLNFISILFHYNELFSIYLQCSLLIFGKFGKIWKHVCKGALSFSDFLRTSFRVSAFWLWRETKK